MPTSQRAAHPSPASRKPRASRRGRYAAVALSFAVSIALTGFEFGVRALGLAPPLPNEYSRFVADELLPWKPEPGSHRSGRSRSDEFDFDYRHNALGFRDTDHEFDKPAGVVRIVGIGDSFTYGVGARYEHTYLSQIERVLAERSQRPVEVIKLGIPRYWPEPERLVLEHYGIQFQPDLVVIGVPPNDFHDTRAGLQELEVSDGYLVSHGSSRLSGGLRWFYLHSHGARSLFARWLRTNPPLESWDDMDAVWRSIHSEHRRMIELASSVGARTLIVHIPQKPPWVGWAPDPPARLARFCEDAGCSFVDVLPAAQAHPEPASLYYPADGHCTEAGYELVAREILKVIARDALLPRLERPLHAELALRETP